MKQFLSIAVLAMLSLSSFASPDTNASTPKFLSLKRAFTEAKDMRWVGNDEITKIEFSFNNQYVTGFYDAAGTLLGLAKNISPASLPLLLGKNLKEEFSKHWISGVLEYSNNEGTVYYAMVENGDQKIVLQSAGNNWSVLKKMDK